MRKSILMIAAASVAACCLGACTVSCNDQSEFYKYEQLNSMLSEKYSQISLTVTDTFDEDTTLKSEYVFKYSESEITVEYSVERLTGLSLDEPSADFKTTHKGTAVIKDGAVTGGEEVGITADMASLKFNFKESYFENATLTGVYLKADVKSVGSFLGLALDCTDMKVYAEFLEVFYNISLSYKQGDNKIVYDYVFTR